MLRLLAPRSAADAGTRCVPITLPDGRSVSVRWAPHPRARRLKLLVDERGARLTVPPRVSERDAHAFVQQHRQWLQQQLQSVQTDAEPAWHVGQCDQLPLRGVLRPVHWSAARSTRVCMHDDGLLFEVRGLRTGAPADAGVRRALRDFYLAQARADVARWLPRHLHGLPRPPVRIAFKRMTSLWGSLSPADVVTLDLSLVLARPAAFEYVLVHELCHLLHADHSRAFWRQVEHRLPDWACERSYLRAEGRRLKARLRGLLDSPPATA